MKIRFDNKLLKIFNLQQILKIIDVKEFEKYTIAEKKR